MNEKQEIFTNFMNEFVKLNIDQKNREIINKLKLILTFLDKVANEKGLEHNLLQSREINDILNDNGTNEDYLEAMMVYAQNIEELLGLILVNDNTFN